MRLESVRFELMGLSQIHDNLDNVPLHEDYSNNEADSPHLEQKLITIRLGEQ